MSAAAAFVLAFFAGAILQPSSAEAHGAHSKKSDRYEARRSHRKWKSRKSYHRYRSNRRDRAIFAHEVDLSRPGGPQRFFELINEESR